MTDSQAITLSFENERTRPIFGLTVYKMDTGWAFWGTPGAVESWDMLWKLSREADLEEDVGAVGWSPPETELPSDKTKEGRQLLLTSQQRNKQQVFAQYRSGVRTLPNDVLYIATSPYLLVAKHCPTARGAMSSFISWYALSCSGKSASVLKTLKFTLYIFYHLSLS